MSSLSNIKVDEARAALQDAVKSVLKPTSIGSMLDRFESSVSGGKMIRGHLVMVVGSGSGMAMDELCKLGAAMELLHAGSLLHDDIIDGGTERRNAPALWVSDGVKGAVLVGDLLLSLALGIVLEHAPERMPVLVHSLRNMCDAEAEQEFADADAVGSWEDCIRIARNKTGVLFGLAAACGAGGDAALASALESAGIDLGTAYQLADDLLDISPAGEHSGKSLGTDAATGKLTAASFEGDADPLAEIESLLQSAEDYLVDWPQTRQCWQDYVSEIIRPILTKFTDHIVAS
jgi:geranylgeranyl pyrophosphate synthase